MQKPDAASFLAEVCQKVRWKKARPVIARELKDHITDQTEAYLHDGMARPDAEERAVSEMGDAQTLGREFDEVYRPRTQWSLLAFLLLLLACGYVCRCLAGLPGAEYTLGTVAGLFLAAAVYYTDLQFFQSWFRWLYAGYLLAVLAVQAVGGRVNGTSPLSSYLLLLLPLLLSGGICRQQGNGWGGFLLCIGAAALPLLFSLPAVSASSLITAGGSCLLLLCWAAARRWFGALPKAASLLLLLLPAAAILTVFCTAAAQRLLPALFPALDPQGAGYLPGMVRTLLANAQMFGPAKLPETAAAVSSQMQADFLLTYLISRYGWIMMVPVCTLFALFCARGAQLCRKQNSFFGKLASAAVLSVFALQALAYIISNCGVPLLTYFPFPLFSGGNLSLLVNLGLLGALLSVFRHGNLYADPADVAPRTLFSYADGNLTIHLRRS